MLSGKACRKFDAMAERASSTREAGLCPFFVRPSPWTIPTKLGAGNFDATGGPIVHDADKHFASFVSGGTIVNGARRAAGSGEAHSIGRAAAVPCSPEPRLLEPRSTRALFVFVLHVNIGSAELGNGPEPRPVDCSKEPAGPNRCSVTIQ